MNKWNHEDNFSFLFNCNYMLSTEPREVNHRCKQFSDAQNLRKKIDCFQKLFSA